MARRRGTDRERAPLPDSTVLFMRVGPEASLLPPGADQRLTPDGAVRTSSPSDGDRSPTAGGSGSSGSAASPYGCVMSTPHLGPEAAYRYEAVYAFFPERIAEAAGEAVRMTEIVLASRTAYASGARSEPHVLRHARCRIPAAEGAHKLLRARLSVLPPAPPSSDKHLKSNAIWKGVPLDQMQGPNGKTIRKVGELISERDIPEKKGDCAIIVYEMDCSGDYCWLTIGKCIMEPVVVEADLPSGGGGGGDDRNCNDLLTDCGNDPDGCNSDGQVADDVCDEGNSGGGAGSGGSAPTASPCILAASQLDEAVFENETDDKAVKTFQALVNKYGGKFGLDSKAKVKHFLAQVAHENANRVVGAEMDVPISDEELLQRRIVERGEPRRDGDDVYNFERVTNSKKLRFCIHYAEADELGNGDASTCDGWKYRGRGPMQLTGEYNYEQFNQEYQTLAKEHGWSHPDIVENPELVSNNARIGTMAALEYWDRRVDGKLDNNPTVEEITEAINGGGYGLADRKEQYDAIKENVDCVE